MKQLLSLVALFLCVVPAVEAREIAGIVVPDQAIVAGQTLRLNGSGIRSKFFIKVYVGSLYTARPVTNLTAAAAESHALIRMNFLHSKVDRDKIVTAFAEGLEKNSPTVAGSDEARRFLAWFGSDFVKGDQVDLELAAGVVSVRHNGRLLGTLTSPALARGILGIYLGEDPADGDLKEGLLGG